MKNFSKIKKNIGFLIPFITKNVPLYLPINIIKIIITSIKPFINIILSKLLVDYLIIGNINNICFITLMIILSNFIINIIEYVLQIIINIFIYKISETIELTLNKKSVELEYEQLENPKIIDMIEKANLGITTYTKGVSENIELFNLIISNIIVFLGCLSIVFYMNTPYLILISIISLVFNYYIEKQNLKYEVKWNEPLTKTSRRFEYYNYALKGFNYAKDIRLYHSQDMIEKYSDEINEIRNIARKRKSRILFRLSIPKTIYLNLIENLLNFLILISLAYSNKITISEFSMLFTSLVTFTTSITSIISSIQRYGKVALYQEYFIDFLLMPTSFNENVRLNKKTMDIESIEFKNVSFKYPRTDKYILKNINFKISKGEKISIVGLNGSGKTTLIKLLCRLYKIDEGEILINGININNYDIEELYKIIAVVFQDFKIISFSVKDNIENISDNQEKLYVCLEQAGILDKIKDLPNKEYTYINKWFDENGVEFSGGEMQKIAIARALYKNSSIVILDEPTAALDPKSEEEIYLKFNLLMSKEKITIFISHRLSSCKFCDKIIVLDNQVITEVGSHKELIQKENGLYKKMYEAQAEYYI